MYVGWNGPFRSKKFFQGSLCKDSLQSGPGEALAKVYQEGGLPLAPEGVDGNHQAACPMLSYTWLVDGRGVIIKLLARPRYTLRHLTSPN